MLSWFPHITHITQALQAKEVQTVARIKEHMETARRVLDKWLPLHGKQLYLARVAERRLATLVVNYVPDPYHVRAVAERSVSEVVVAAFRSGAVVARTLATVLYTQSILPTARTAEAVVARGLAGCVGRNALLRYRVKESTARWYARGLALTLPPQAHVRALKVLRANVEVRVCCCYCCCGCGCGCCCGCCCCCCGCGCGCCGCCPCSTMYLDVAIWPFCRIQAHQPSPS